MLGAESVLTTDMQPIKTTHGELDFTARPLVMGILNVTPDSFSDGNQYLDPATAARHALTLQNEGADLIDVGAESSRPGSDPVAVDEQIRRLVPAIRQTRDAGVTVPISVDTRLAGVAAAALDAGADFVNDIAALRDDPDLKTLVAERGVAVVLMHMAGTPTDMQDDPRYDDVVAEIVAFLEQRIAAAVDAGITRERIIIDPGIGFGKRNAHNLEILRRLGELQTLKRPILVGTSRKMFIGAATDTPEPADRLMGTAATVSAAVLAGANILRVHDVAAMRQVVAMSHAINASANK